MTFGDRTPLGPGRKSIERGSTFANPRSELSKRRAGRKCETCGGPLDAQQARFCGQQCIRRDNYPPKYVTRTCEACGETFDAKPHDVKRGRARFCSRSCSARRPRVPAPKGAEHPNWKGDDVEVESGRGRARSLYAVNTCERCGRPGLDRHHRDGDTTNNAPENIEILCRRCHMDVDGRLEAFERKAAEINARRRATPPPPCIECGTQAGRRDRWYGRCHTCNERGRREWARALEGAYCGHCGTRDDLEGHHVVPKRRLRDRGHLLAMWDLRNQVALCHDCHEAVTNGSLRLSRDELPESAEEFAIELGMTTSLERDYEVTDETQTAPEVGW